MTDGIEYIAQPAAAGGASDHGDLTGLGDDDHPQYETSAEAAAKVTAHEAAANPHSVYALDTDLSTHEADTTAIHGITDTSALATTSGVTSAVSTHAGLADPHTGYVQEALVDAKGDLIAGSAADTVARLAVGANDTILTADSAAGTGVKWAAPAAAAGTAGGDLSGTYPNPQIGTGVIVNADVNGSAAIARAKLDFGSGLVNADIAAAAAIVKTKLAALGIVNADVDAAAAIVYSKLNLAASIVNADVSASAALAESKLGLSHRMFFRTGAYYGAAGSNETGALTLDRLFALPFPVSRSVTFDRIGVEVTSAGSAGAVVRLGIYNDHASGGYPGTVLLDAGTIDSTGTGWKEITISQAVTPGLYWLAAVMQVATCSVRVCGGLNANFMIGSQDGANTAGANAGYQHVGASGALPTFQSSMSVIAAAPKVRVRVA